MSVTLCGPGGALIAAIAISALCIIPAQSTAKTDGGASHTYDVTYRGFGPVTAASVFRDADGYQLRFEGCYAKHSPEALCGFTLRAVRPVVVSNADKLAHGVRRDGSPMRSCCLFIQGEPEGHPLIAQGAGDGSIAILRRWVEAGRDVGVLLRLPDYRTGSPLQSVVFSRGEGDKGLSFPATIAELP